MIFFHKKYLKNNTYPVPFTNKMKLLIDISNLRKRANICLTILALLDCKRFVEF